MRRQTRAIRMSIFQNPLASKSRNSIGSNESNEEEGFGSKRFRTFKSFVCDQLEEKLLMARDGGGGHSRSKLRRYEIELINHILQETINHLTIVNNGKIEEMVIEPAPSLNQRFQNYQQPLYNLNTFEHIDEEKERMINTEIERDVMRLMQILKNTMHELNTKGTFSTLTDYIDEDSSMETDETELITDYVKNQNMLKLLELKLIRCQAEHEKAVKKLDTKIFDLDNQLHDLTVMNGIKCRFFQNWETARQQQTFLGIQRKEQELISMNESLLNNIEREKTCNEETENYLGQRIQYINNLTEYWIEKYERELEALDLEIQINTETISDTTQKTIALEELFAQRKINIETYRVYRAKKDIIVARIRKRNDSALAIQCWYRGIRARRDMKKLIKKWKRK